MGTTGKTFAAIAGLLLAVGLLLVCSASMTSRPTERETVYLLRQGLFLAVALLAGGLATLVPSEGWRRAAPALLAATLLLLAIVLIPGVGTTVKGARRWLRYGGLTIQPSEIAKLTLPLYVCGMAADGGWRRSGAGRTLLLALAPIAVTLGLVLIEPDLGTALFLGVTAGVALFECGWPLARFGLLLGLAAPLGLGLMVLRPYQLARVQGFLAAWQDFEQAPYQVRQSLTAIGSGGLWGRGLGLGEQKLSFLPEANTDFVFAVIGEELGLVGTLGVIGLWVAFYVCGLALLGRLRRGSFAHAWGLTLLTSLTLQALLNMAVVTALAPPKGISLPLISYGGSGLVMSVTMVGVILGLTRNRAAVSAPVTPSPRAVTPPVTASHPPLTAP